MDDVEVLNIFNKKNGEWPKKIALKLFNSNEQSDIYTVQSECYMITKTVEPNVYHCQCSKCGNSSDPWDAYCRHCGARSLGAKSN